MNALNRIRRMKAILASQLIDIKLEACGCSFHIIFYTETTYKYVNYCLKTWGKKHFVGEKKQKPVGS